MLEQTQKDGGQQSVYAASKHAVSYTGPEMKEPVARHPRMTPSRAM